MKRSLVSRLSAVLGLLALGGCGVQAVAGHYAGTVNGSVTVLGVSFPVNGDLGFDLSPAAKNDVLDASGDLKVTKMSDGSVIYQATIAGQYSFGKLDLTFTATDGSSSGTMTATRSASCWANTAWTFTGNASSGSGTFSACLQPATTAGTD